MVLFRRILSLTLALQLAVPGPVWAAKYSPQFSSYLGILMNKTIEASLNPTIDSMDQLKLAAYTVGRFATNSDERALIEAFNARIEEIKEVRKVIDGKCRYKNFDTEALSASSSAEMLRELTVTDCAPEGDESVAEQLALTLSNVGKATGAATPAAASNVDRLIAHSMVNSAYDHMLLEHMTVGVETDGFPADLNRAPELTLYDALLDAEIWRSTQPRQVSEAKFNSGRKGLSEFFKTLVDRESGSQAKGIEASQQEFLKAAIGYFGHIPPNLTDVGPGFRKSLETAKGMKARGLADQAAIRVAALKQVRASDPRPGTTRLVENFKKQTQDYRKRVQGAESSQLANVKLAGVLRAASSAGLSARSRAESKVRLAEIHADGSIWEQQREKMNEYSRTLDEGSRKYSEAMDAWKKAGYPSENRPVREAIPNPPDMKGIQPSADAQRLILQAKTDLERARVFEAEWRAANRTASIDWGTNQDGRDIVDLAAQGQTQEAEAKLSAMLSSAISPEGNQSEEVRDLVTRTRAIPRAVFARFEALKARDAADLQKGIINPRDLFLQALGEPHEALHGHSAFSVVSQSRDFMSALRMASRGDLDYNPLTYANKDFMNFVENGGPAPTDEALRQGVRDISSQNALAVKNISSLRFTDDGREKTDYAEQINKALIETPHAIGGLLTLKSTLGIGASSVSLSTMLCGRLTAALANDEKKSEAERQANMSYERNMAIAGLAVAGLGLTAFTGGTFGLAAGGLAAGGGLVLGGVGVYDAVQNRSAVIAQRERTAALLALARAEERTVDAASGTLALSEADQAVSDANWGLGTAVVMGALQAVPATRLASLLRGESSAARFMSAWTASNFALGGAMGVKAEFDIAPRIRALEEQYEKLNEAALKACAGGAASSSACVQAEMAAAKAKSEIEYEKTTQNLNRISALVGFGAGLKGLSAQAKARRMAEVERFNNLARKGLAKGRDAVTLANGKLRIKTRTGETAELQVDKLDPAQQKFAEEFVKATSENNAVRSATENAGLSPELAEVYQILKSQKQDDAAEAFLREIEEIGGDQVKRRKLLERFCVGNCEGFCKGVRAAG